MKKNKFFTMLTILGITICFIAIIVKLSYINISDTIDGVDLVEYANNRNTTKKTLYASRGSIYDSKGNYLAQTVNSYTLIAYLSKSRTTNENNPQHVVDKENTAKKLSELFIQNGYEDLTYEYILSRLNTENVYQVEFRGAKDISESLKRKIEELNLPGLDFVASSKRYYQMGDFASYIVGYAKKDSSGDTSGEMGIEKYYNDNLKGENGSVEYQTDNYGYKLPNSTENKVEAVSGNDIYLTIDNNIQLFVEQEINTLASNYDFTWLTLTVADAKTGAILASSSSPSFDANKLNITNYLNPLVSYSYEPGSTMKIFSFMAAMEYGVYDGDETYQSGTIKVSDTVIKDSNNVGWGTITFDEGFAHSSNVAATILAQRLGKENLKEFYTKLGFGQKTGITLPDEVSGDIDFNYETEIATASFGQGITTTPIQNIQALTTLANDGVMLKPYIVSKIVNSDTNEVIYSGERTELGQVVSSKTASKMRDLMNLAVVEGYTNAKFFKSDLVNVIGKSGTAQIAGNNGYLTGENDYIKSVAALFPYEDPQYIIYFSVKQFQGNFKYAGEAVVNVINEIVKYKNLATITTDTSNIFTLDSYLNTDVESTKEKLKDINLVILGNGNTVINQYPLKNTKILKNDTKVFIKTNSTEYSMPDVTGYSKKDLISLCNLLNIKYNITGSGNVVSQSKEVGSTIIPNEDVTFTLD